MSQRNNSGGSQGRDAKGRWRKGISGNPTGPPAGSKCRAKRELEALLDGEGERLTRKAIELALGGDVAALRLCLERLLPPRKDRPVTFPLPKLEDASDLTSISGALLAAAARGELTPSEASEFAKLIEGHRRTIETAELERRLAALEAQQEGKR